MRAVTRPQGNGPTPPPAAPKFRVVVEAAIDDAADHQAAATILVAHLRSGKPFTCGVVSADGERLAFTAAEVEPVNAVEASQMRQLLQRLLVLAVKGMIQPIPSATPILTELLQGAEAIVARKPLIIVPG
jgi:hypothetical protein